MTRPQSNFDFVDAEFRGLATLRRLLSQIRQHGGRAIVHEKLRESKDLLEENEDIDETYSDFSGSRTFRLSFFRTPIDTIEKLSLLSDNELIGYAIIKEDSFDSKRQRESRIYESVVRCPDAPNHFVKREPVSIVRVGKKLFRIRGHLYAQQNGTTNCCGHVAVRTVIASAGQREMSYRKMNQILGLPSETRNGGDGIDTAEMVKILRSAGVRCFVADYRPRKKKALPPAPFQKYVYGSVESGYPAIISFQTRDDPVSFHAIPIFGHTTNCHTWVPSAERSYFRIGGGTKYIPSESWVSMYVGHDDNWGSNFCIPRHYFQTQHPESENGGSAVPPVECVVHVISTVPKRVRLSPIRAEVIGADYLLALRKQFAKVQKNAWGKRLNKYASQNLLVLRPILISPKDYCSHLTRIRDWKHNRIDPEIITALEALPDEKLWMIELSVPELFSTNFRKVGEVLVRAERKLGPDRWKSFLLARLPGYFALRSVIRRGRPRFTFLRAGADDHVELFGYEEGG